MAPGASATLVPEDDANPDDTRSMIAEWVETRRVWFRRDGQLEDWPRDADAACGGLQA